MTACLIRVIRIGRILFPTQAEEWLFPADSSTGYLAEHKELRDTLAKWGNELRQTYRTVGQAAGIADLDIRLLMNHALPGANAGYITRAKLLNDHLRKQQETISRTMLAVRPNADERSHAYTKWPLLPFPALSQRNP